MVRNQVSLIYIIMHNPFVQLRGRRFKIQIPLVQLINSPSCLPLNNHICPGILDAIEHDDVLLTFDNTAAMGSRRPEIHHIHFIGPDEITPPGTPDLSRALLKSSFATPGLRKNRRDYSLTPPNSQVEETTYTILEPEDKHRYFLTPPTSQPRTTTCASPELASINNTHQSPLTPPASQPRPPHELSHLLTPPATTPRPLDEEKFSLPTPETPDTLLNTSSLPSLPSSPSPEPSTPHCSKCTSSLSPQSPILLPCSHTFCPSCLRKTFRYTLFSQPFRGPASCYCSPFSSSLSSSAIPLAVIGQIAKPAEFEAYCDKLREWEARTEASASGIGRGEEAGRKSKPLYCYKSECGMFINIWGQRTCSGTCPKCGERTCRLCGGKAHMFGRLGAVGRKERRVRTRDGRGRRRGRERCARLCPLSGGARGGGKGSE